MQVRVVVEGRLSDGKQASFLCITIPKLDVAGSSPVARSITHQCQRRNDSRYGDAIDAAR